MRPASRGRRRGGHGKGWVPHLITNSVGCQASSLPFPHLTVATCDINALETDHLRHLVCQWQQYPLGGLQVSDENGLPCPQFTDPGTTQALLSEPLWILVAFVLVISGRGSAGSPDVYLEASWRALPGLFQGVLLAPSEHTDVWKSTLWSGRRTTRMHPGRVSEEE